MKKILLFLLILPWITLTSSKAELGVGLGTSGLSLKPGHQHTVFSTLRTGFGAGYSIESFDLALTPELTVNIKLLNQESYFLYGGLGMKGFARANFGSTDDIYNFTLYFMMPIGIECRPLPSHQNLAFCLEAQVNFARSGTIDPGVFGVFEIVYYFKTKK